MKIIIAWFSWKGHTQIVAWELAKILNATSVNIEPSSPVNPVIGGIKALLGMKSRIKPATVDIRDYDHLVIATPVWSHNIPPYVRQYLSELKNFEGKNFSVLVEMGGSGADTVVKKIREILEEKEMEFVTSAVTVEKQVEANTFTPVIATFSETILGS